MGVANMARVEIKWNAKEYSVVPKKKKKRQRKREKEQLICRKIENSKKVDLKAKTRTVHTLQFKDSCTGSTCGA